MDVLRNETRLRYRIEHRLPGGELRVIGRTEGLPAASRAFADAFAGLVGAGECGTVSLIWELDDQTAPIVTRRIAPGIAG